MPHVTRRDVIEKAIGLISNNKAACIASAIFRASIELKFGWNKSIKLLKYLRAFHIELDYKPHPFPSAYDKEINILCLLFAYHSLERKRVCIPTHKH